MISPEGLVSYRELDAEGVYILKWHNAEDSAAILASQPTAEDIWNDKVSEFTSAIQFHLDTLAQSWGYDHILSLCTYADNSSPKYSAEGLAGKTWRSVVWEYCETELEKIALGTRPEPESTEAFIAELPTITRPIV